MAMKRGHTGSGIQVEDPPPAQIAPRYQHLSDFIIGFRVRPRPDFAATMKLVEEIGFDSSFSFVYSAVRALQRNCPTHR